MPRSCILAPYCKNADCMPEPDVGVVQTRGIVGPGSETRVRFYIPYFYPKKHFTFKHFRHIFMPDIWKRNMGKGNKIRYNTILFYMNLIRSTRIFLQFFCIFGSEHKFPYLLRNIVYICKRSTYMSYISFNLSSICTTVRDLQN